MIDTQNISNNHKIVMGRLQSYQTTTCPILLGVSKGQSAEKIHHLIALGLKSYGENRVQEAQAKWPAIKNNHPDIALHLIGGLQTNKAEDAVALFDVIETVDRTHLIDALRKAQDKLGLKRRYFIQVNIGSELQKSGVSIEALQELLAYARSKELAIDGLMCIPPEGVPPAPYFALLKKLAQRHGLKKLSMGMSSDYKTALDMGSTEIRVGTMLFGERDL